MKRYLLSVLVGTVILFNMGISLTFAETSSSNEKIIQISAMSTHQLFLKSDGTVWSVGQNLMGEIGDGSTNFRDKPFQVPGLANIKKVVAGAEFSVALSNNGDLFTWGSNEFGQLGINNSSRNATMPQLVLTDVTDADTINGDEVLALTRDGSLYDWGNDTGPSAGLGMGIYNYFAPMKFKTDLKFVKLARNFLVNDANEVYQFTPFNNELKKINVSNVKNIYIGFRDKFLLLNDGTVMHQEPPEDSDFFKGPVLHNLVSMSAGLDHFVAKDSNNVLWAWGSNNSGQLGKGNTQDYDTPQKITADVDIFDAAYGYTVIIKTNEDVQYTGEFSSSTGRVVKTKFSTLFKASDFGISLTPTTEPTASYPSFTDISGHWAETDINSLASLGIISGFADNTFRPDEKVTRDQFVKLLTQSLNLSTSNTTTAFVDVSATNWANTAISTAIDSGIIVPSEIGTKFHPASPISRFDMSIMVARALKLQGNGDLSVFKDGSRITDHRDLVSGVVSAKILTGYVDKSFKPGNSATRAESTVVIRKILDFLKA